MFANMDTDNSGTITYEELKSGLARLGSKLSEAEVKQLMEAVSMIHLTKFICLLGFLSDFLVLCILFMVLYFRLMWMEMERLTTLSLLLQQCIDIDLKGMMICSKLFSILMQTIAGESTKAIIISVFQAFS